MRTRKTEERLVDRLVPHPLSARFPPLSETEYAELRESIRSLGLLDPIIYNLKGEILSGNNRYRILKELGWELESYCYLASELLDKSLSEAEEVQLVFDSNIHRRNLTDDQRVAIAAEFLPLLKEKAAAARLAGQIKGGHARARQVAGESNGGARDYATEHDRSAVGQLAKKAGVPRHKAQLIKALHDKAPAELDKVAKGEVTLAQAAEKVIPGRKHSHTKESRIADPVGAFVHVLGLLCQKPVSYYARLGAGIKEESEVVRKYHKVYDGLERLSAVADAFEVTVPALKGTRG